MNHHAPAPVYRACCRGAFSIVFFMMLIGVLAGCAAPGSPAHKNYVQLPLIAGWHDGQPVYYITTDASDKKTAEHYGANYAPRLALAVPPGPQTPGQRNALERIYKVTNFKQQNIVPSTPTPIGPTSTDETYSPLWRMYLVTWSAAGQPRELRSEEEVLSAQDKGWVTLMPTDIVVNCPIVFSARIGLMPGVKLIGEVK